MGTQSVSRAGVIGLGAMGLQMARHMAAKGFDVRGHDIDAAAMGRAREQKLKTASATEVARHAEVVIVTGSPGALPLRPGEKPEKPVGKVIVEGQLHMRPGDVCEVEVDGLGVLSNPVIEDPTPVR